MSITKASDVSVSDTAWNLYLENEKLVSWAVGRYCRYCSPTQTEEMRSLFEDILFETVKVFDKSKGKFSVYFNKSVYRAVALYNNRNNKKTAALQELTRVTPDFTTDEPIADSDEPKPPTYSQTVLAITAVGLEMGLSTERVELALAVYRGEIAIADAGRKLGITRQAAQKFIDALRKRIANRMQSPTERTI